LIKSIQKAEASGEDTTEMANMTNALLRSVNVHVTSGDFEDDPSEAVASLFQKKASEGTFLLTADKASGRESILFQRSDGKIELAAKRHGFEDHVADVRPERIDSSKGRPAKFPRAEDGDRFDRARPNRDSRGPRFSEDAPEDDGIPISVPYTTAASQFLYGSNAVLAALRGKRRKLYQLYVHPKIFERESCMEADKKSRYAKPAHEFVSLAKEAGIPFRNEFRTHLLDKMSDGRPHNGMVLEASKLPAPPVLGLGKPDARRSIVPLTVAPQSAEDIAVNGDPETISITANSWRHPFVVMLDGITDPGNVGNILRTCHFYGVDAVVVASNTCANLSSAVLAKASSGACEAVRILALPQPSNFVHDSAKAGWKIYAAVAPVATTGRQGKDPKTPEQLTTAAVSSASPLLDHPCILMLGAEGEGLRDNLKNRANAFVSISRGQQLEDSPDVGVDSMNVSVAAGVLLEAFLRKPDGAPEKRDTTGELGF
jgi:21S rRNA (GM2251-2'-O)-methyltransferase